VMSTPGDNAASPKEQYELLEFVPGVPNQQLLLSIPCQDQPDGCGSTPAFVIDYHDEFQDKMTKQEWNTEILKLNHILENESPPGRGPVIPCLVFVVFFIILYFAASSQLKTGYSHGVVVFPIGAIIWFARMCLCNSDPDTPVIRMNQKLRAAIDEVNLVYSPRGISWEINTPSYEDPKSWTIEIKISPDIAPQEVNGGPSPQLGKDGVYLASPEMPPGNHLTIDVSSDMLPVGEPVAVNGLDEVFPILWGGGDQDENEELVSK